MIWNGNGIGLLLGKPMIGYLETGCLATNGGCKWSGDRALVKHILSRISSSTVHVCASPVVQPMGWGLVQWLHIGLQWLTCVNGLQLLRA